MCSCLCCSSFPPDTTADPDDKPRRDARPLSALLFDSGVRKSCRSPVTGVTRAQLAIIEARPSEWRRAEFRHFFASASGF